MGLRFTKMHGLGNDFVVLDARESPLTLDIGCIRAIADRHTGVGFDQMMILEPARDAACLAAYTIRNADGTIAPQCGNGARCLGAWMHRAGVLAIGDEATLQSPVGIVKIRLVDATTVTVDMGEPEFEPARIPFAAPAAADTYPIDVDGERIEISAASMGSRHAVIEVDDIASSLTDRLGPRITVHPRFPQGANACFVRVVDKHFGSCACMNVAPDGRSPAAAAPAPRWPRCIDGAASATRFAWKCPGARSRSHGQGPGHVLSMTGPAAFPFDGEWLGS
jgi:diaminopimelate epimerase